MEKIRKIKLEHAFIFVCMICLLAVFVNRLTLGIETSDEAYYAATGYRFMQGNVPFGDMWETSAGDAYLMAPFLFIRSLFTDSTEGIFLYLRLCFLPVCFFGAWAAYVFTKIDIDREFAFLLGLFFFFFAPFQLYNFSYNNLSYVFIGITSFLILAGIRKDRKLYLFLSGTAMALAVLSYPTMIYQCVIMAVIIPLIVRWKKSIQYLFLYAAGGITTALPVMIHLAVSEGFGNVIGNLGIILSTNAAPSLSVDRIFECILSAIVYLGAPFAKMKLPFLLFWLVFIGCGLFKRTKLISKYLILLYPILCASYAAGTGVQAVMNFVFPMVLLGPTAILLSANPLSMLRKCSLEWGVSMLIYFITVISTTGGASNAMSGAIIAAVVSMKLVIETFSEEPPVRFRRLCVYTLLFILVICEVCLFYAGTYREPPCRSLTEKVDSGVFKGIYTTAERKQHIQDLESVLSQAEDKGETVMVLYHSCYAYLMLDMVPKTPSTWGCFDYQAYGYDNQSLFMHYLSVPDNVPENILIIDIPEAFDYAGQQLERYEPYYPDINAYIDEHYVFAGTYEEGLSGTVTKYKVDWSTF